MDIFSTRRARLKMLVDELAGGNAARFAAMYGYSRSQIYQFLSPKYNDGRSMGERAARELETKLNGQPGWLDRPIAPLDSLISEANFATPNAPPTTESMGRNTSSRHPGVPVLGRIHVSKDGAILDTVKPKNKGDVFLELYFQGRDLFALQIIGILQWPRLKSGDLIVVERGLAPGPGDDVLLTHANGSSIVQLLHTVNEVSVFGLVNDMNPILSLSKDKIVSMDRIIMIVSHLDDACIEIREEIP